MGRIVYATQLWTDAADISSVMEEYNRWISQFYQRNYGTQLIEPFGGSIEGLPGDHQVSLVSATNDTSEIYDLDWRYPDPEETDLIWRNMVRVAEISGSCLFEHRVMIEALNFVVRPTPISVGAPNVIRRLCKRDVVRFADLRLRATPYFFSSQNMDKFLTLLQSDARTLPVVMLTPYANGDSPCIDADALAGALAGVAIVVEAVDQDATWEFRAEVGKDLACFDGGARIYWPGFARGGAKRIHPLYLGQRIRERPEIAKSHIEQTVFSVASEKFVPHAEAEEIFRKSQAAARRAQLPEDAESNEWKRLAEAYLDQLDKAEQTIRDLHTQMQNAQALHLPVSSEPAELDSAEDQAEPTSVLEAVQNAQRKCTNLTIADSAHKAATESPFVRPREIQDALEQLNAVAREWQERRQAGQAGGDIRRMLMDRGLGKRCSMHISDTTRGRYRSDYTFNVNGEQVLVEPHITLGSGDAARCASIHFVPPTDDRQIIVVHVGRHLPNTKA